MQAARAAERETNSVLTKLSRVQSEQRTKKAALNLAKAGAAQDTRGVVHVGAKGARQFFQQRKRQILSLNREHFEAENDEVKLSADEYLALKEAREAGALGGKSGGSSARGGRGQEPLPAITKTVRTQSE